MNILIYGPSASGKTRLANALVAQDERKGQKTEIIDDDKFTNNFEIAEKWTESFIKKAKITKGNKLRHIIVTTQAFPEEHYGYYTSYKDLMELYDYIINTRRV